MRQELVASPNIYIALELPEVDDMIASLSGFIIRSEQIEMIAVSHYGSQIER
jgi:hypothetical protein